jgi:pimeloyl-ACP methyl ester carboxylesterase
MLTERIPVAEGVELAVDTWPPALDRRRSAAAWDAAAGSGGGTSSHGSFEPPAFVLVHGLASNARVWDGVAADLAAAGHLVATVDLRGHGRSSKPDGPYDVATVADDVAGLIAGLELDRPLVAGQSWGGNVVLELAARHPEATRGIVCVDGGWLEPSRVFPDWEACRAALSPPHLVGRPLAEIEGYLRTTHRDWPEVGIRGTLANFEVRPDGTVAPWLTFERHLAILRGLWEHHPAARYPEIAVPALLVPADGGEKDWTERKRHDVDAALAAIPSARARWFRGDHDIQAQHPDELADVMLTMIRERFFA